MKNQKLVVVTNNVEDHILLTEGERVVSAWKIGDGPILQRYLNHGDDPDRFPDHCPKGIRLERENRYARVADYGVVCGERGAIFTEERRTFWLGVKADGVM